jgi:hypothetical protein
LLGGAHAAHAQPAEVAAGLSAPEPDVDLAPSSLGRRVRDVPPPLHSIEPRDAELRFDRSRGFVVAGGITFLAGAGVTGTGLGLMLSRCSVFWGDGGAGCGTGVGLAAGGQAAILGANLTMAIAALRARTAATDHGAHVPWIWGALAVVFALVPPTQLFAWIPVLIQMGATRSAVARLRLHPS